MHIDLKKMGYSVDEQDKIADLFLQTGLLYKRTFHVSFRNADGTHRFQTFQRLEIVGDRYRIPNDEIIENAESLALPGQSIVCILELFTDGKDTLKQAEIATNSPFYASAYKMEPIFINMPLFEEYKRQVREGNFD